MTRSLVALLNVCKYDGKQHIQIVDDSTCHITMIDNLKSSFIVVFMSPDLFVNLIFVGQLVEENCSFSF